MKTIDSFIQERLVINSKSKTHSIQPKDKTELRDIIEKRLRKDKNGDLNDIDVSQIEDMSYLFDRYEKLNFDISEWDVSNVKDMSHMFEGCHLFNCDLSKWDVSNVENMNCMFAYCYEFNCDLSNWDISQVNYMTSMFEGCEKFNCDLENWDISNVDKYNVYAMKDMFRNCKSLKKIPSWYKE